MQNTLGEATVVKSLATTIHKRLVNPAEEQYKQLDGKINDLLDGSRELHAGLREEINELITSVLFTKEELNKLKALHKNTKILAFIAITLTIMNFVFFIVK